MNKSTKVKVPARDGRAATSMFRGAGGHGAFRGCARQLLEVVAERRAIRLSLCGHSSKKV